MKCCICGKEIEKVGDWDKGNNAEPIVVNGRCCDDCNDNVVIPARINYVFGVRTIKQEPNEALAVVLQTDNKISLYKGKNENKGGFTLAELQAMVDGYIEIYPQNNDKDLLYIVNEEGLMHNLPLNNLALSLLGINAVGNVVIISNNMLK